MKAFWQFILIVILTTLIISVYSFIDLELQITGVVIKKSKIKEFLTFEKAEFKLNIDSIIQIDTIIEEKKDTVVIDTTSQKILIIGDSMLEGLSLRLRDYTAYNGHEINTVIWYSSTSEVYGKCDTLKYFIKTYKPTYVMLVLGANELFISDIKEKRKGYVDEIIKQMDTIPYVWVGPPNWKEDTGINELILEKVGEGKYYPSKNLTYQRASDGAHPTRESAVVWMDSIASWIRTSSNYRIKLEVPDKRYKISANTTLLQPIK